MTFFNHEDTATADLLQRLNVFVQEQEGGGGASRGCVVPHRSALVRVPAAAALVEMVWGDEGPGAVVGDRPPQLDPADHGQHVALSSAGLRRTRALVCALVCALWTSTANLLQLKL